MGKMSEIQFTRVKFKALKRAYQKAVDDELEMFQFEGHDLLVSYAKYLIEYLEKELPK